MRENTVKELNNQKACKIHHRLKKKITSKFMEIGFWIFTWRMCRNLSEGNGRRTHSKQGKLIKSKDQETISKKSLGN